MLISVLFFILSLVAEVITGERSNIEGFFGFVILLYFSFHKIKNKNILINFFIRLLVIIILSFDYLKLRYNFQFRFYLFKGKLEIELLKIIFT